MSNRELGDVLARRWLAGIGAFSPKLIDTGETYNGNPVFDLNYRWATDDITVKVYRYTPINAEHSVLAFLPEGDGA